MNRAFYRLVAVCGVVLTMAAAGAAQDFSKKYELGAGGHINIHSVSGDVTITGYNGSAVLVTATKKGRDRDMVEIEDLSTGDRVELRSRYPEQCNCEASINFTVQVPRGVKYSFDKISSASGDIKISGVTGDINGRSASGDVTIEEVEGSISASSASGDVRVRKAVGTVNARSASGDVEVDLAGVVGTSNMEFTSASGDVRVKAPADLDADVEMSCISGNLKTDFALSVNEPEHGSRRSAHGRLGSGSRTLRIRSSSGSVSLVHN
ncbi:MAG TPA: DUF4097 family beta strand repeat-containing protein [Blastocatellia bacterium]|nr:DUF4097 family beta strand repeat-containing protein [Blastocatellia bacterium]